MTRLAVLGGSSVATPELLRVLVREPVLPGTVEIALHGRSAGKLDTVGAVCARIASVRPDVSVRWSADLGAVLEGADVVLVQVRVGGYRARAFDEAFPHEFDLPGEETIGPGGFANSLRTVPVVISMARAIERHAPLAWVLNLTNPSSVIQLAIQRTTRLKVVGLCDSPVMMCESVAAVLGSSPDNVRVDYAGMHHFGWILRVERQGRDATAEVLARLDAMPWIRLPAEYVRAIGAIPHPYINYVLAPRAMLQQQRGKRPRALELTDLEDQLLEEYRRVLLGPDGGMPASLSRRRAVWYEKIIVPVFLDLMGDRRRERIVNVRNGKTVPWLPEDAVVEVPAIVGVDGARPRTSWPAPPDVVALTQQNSAYESLLVDAILESSHDKALRAMMLNPLIRDTGTAGAVLARIWPAGGFSA